jgi:hypothetical protein
VTVAQTKGSDTNIPDDWYDDPPDRGWDEEWLRRRTAELGPEFESLVSSVMSYLACLPGKRDQLRPWLISCIDHYKSNKNVRPAVREWLDDVAKKAGALVKVLDRGPPFPPDSVQADFSFVYEDLVLPSDDDIAHLRKMAKAAEVIGRGAYRKIGRAPRVDRNELIRDVERGVEVFASKRATVEVVSEVVCEVLAFIGEPLASDTVSGAVKQVRKTRRGTVR